MSTTQAEVKYTTLCRIPGCGQRFQKSPLDIPIIGQPDKQVIEFVLALLKHTQSKHPEAAAQIAGMVQQFTGFMALSLFECQDPKLSAMKESVRATLHRMTRKNYIADAFIDSKIADLGFDPEDSEGLKLLLTDMRDVLCEEGSYAPANGQPTSPLVKA
jgi:hypothetical protein